MKMDNVVIFLCVLLTAGCASSERKPPETNTRNTEAPSSQGATEMRVAFTELCPVTPDEKEGVLSGIAVSIAANVGAKIVGGAIDVLSSYLTKEEASIFATTSRMDGLFYSEAGKLTLNEFERCMVIAVGSNFSEVSDKKKQAELQILPGKTPSTNLAIYNALKLVSEPNFYAEFRLVSNADHGANPSVFTLVPKFIHYPEFVAEDTLLKKAERDVLLNVEFIEPGQAQAFGSMEMKWTGVKKGDITSAAIRSRKLPWIALPASTGSLKSPGGDQTSPLFPINVKANLIETAKPFTLAKYIGEALKEEKDTITKVAKESIEYSLSQDARLSAKNLAINDIESKYKTYLDAYDTASKSYDLYQAHSPGDAAGKKKMELTTKIAYQKLSLAETALKRSYDNAGVGLDGLLPALPTVQ